MQRTRLTVLLLFALSFLGCNSEDQRWQEFSHIGLLYHNFLDEYLESPSSVTDLEKLLQEFRKRRGQSWSDEHIARKAIDRIKAGEIVLVWNAKIKGNPNFQKQVLGYEKSVNEDQGFVLLGDGNAGMMTNTEFTEFQEIETTEKDN